MRSRASFAMYAISSGCNRGLGVSAPSRIVVALVLAFASARAGAETLGVVVEGPTGEGGPLRIRIESWAIGHEHKIVASPLSVDAARTLANCLVLADRKCAAA